VGRASTPDNACRSCSANALRKEASLRTEARRGLGGSPEPVGKLHEGTYGGRRRTSQGRACEARSWRGRPATLGNERPARLPTAAYRASALQATAILPTAAGQVYRPAVGPDLLQAIKPTSHRGARGKGHRPAPEGLLHVRRRVSSLTTVGPEARSRGLGERTARTAAIIVAGGGPADAGERQRGSGGWPVYATISA
jgi:hypothetical protein